MTNEGPKFYPNEENLGKNCIWWASLERGFGCFFPKAELQQRISCEGMVDEVCLFVKDGRPTETLSQEQILEIKTSPPDLSGGRKLPAGS